MPYKDISKRLEYDRKRSHLRYEKIKNDQKYKKMIKANNIKWAKNNPLKVKESKHKHYINHKESILAKHRNWLLKGDNYEKHKAYKKRYHYNIWKEMIVLYGGKCSCCGENEIKFLNIDHINGGGHKDYVENGNTKTYRRIIKENNQTKYRVLCSNCNIGRQRNGGICPHKEKK